MPVELTNPIETLAAQAELALDRETLTETFHARRSEARFQTLVQNASDVILIARPDATITYQTPSATRILGYEPGSLEGERITSTASPRGRRTGTGCLHRSRVSGRDVRHGPMAHPPQRRFLAARRGGGATTSWAISTVEGIVLTMRDVSERKGLEEELKHQAFHDALSGLANRALFLDRLEHALARAARSRSLLAVLFLDLDDFKLVNDSLGHAAGDELLVAVAGRLIKSLRVGRHRGPLRRRRVRRPARGDLGPRRGLSGGRTHHRRAARAPCRSKTARFRCTRASGSPSARREHEGPAELLQAADVAMYAAKARGKGRYEVYKPALQAAMVERLERTADLQRAVDEQEFVVHYQPIVSLDGGATITGVRGARALAAPRTRAAAPEGVHPAGRGDRPHHPARTMGAARGVPTGSPVAAELTISPTHSI